jgi:glycosyltransferase involved in cell wall biosynthesis
MKAKQRVIAVIPMYNEAERVRGVIEGALRHVDAVVAVDDQSQDSSYEVARKSGATVLRNHKNRGAGYTTRKGCDKAAEMGADIIITMDADGQHDPEDIPLMLEPLRGGDLDITFGSRRRDSNMPPVKRLGNWMLSSFARMIYRIGIRDSQTGFHAFTREAYPGLRWESDRYGVVSEFVMRVSKNKLRYREVEVKTIYNEKDIGMTKVDALKSVAQMIKWRIRA